MSPNTFRRQNITLIQEEGATPFEAMEQAGHTRSTMTSLYTVVALTDQSLTDRPQ